MGWLTPSAVEQREMAVPGGWSPVGSAWISTDTATRQVAFLAAIRCVVDYLATTPVKFYRERPDGTKERITPPALIQNVTVEYGTLGNWLGQAAYGIATRGNAVGRITATSGYSTTGRVLPTMIRWASSWQASDHGAPDWFLDGSPVSPATVAHIPWIVPAGRLLGLSPVSHTATVIKAALAAQRYADVERGGGIPPAILKNNMKILNETAAGAVRDRAVESFAAGKPFVSGKDWDLTLTTIPPVQAQFIEVMKMSATQIAAVFGLDPREIGGEAASSLNYTTDESRPINRAHDLRPFRKRMEDAISSWLPGGQTMRYDIDDTIRADTKTQAEVENIRLANGTLSIDEVRARHDEPPLPNGQGSTYNVPRPTSPAPAVRQGDNHD